MRCLWKGVTQNIPEISSYTLSYQGEFLLMLKFHFPEQFPAYRVGVFIYFSQFYGDLIEAQRPVSLRCTTWWLGTKKLQNDY